MCIFWEWLINSVKFKVLPQYIYKYLKRLSKIHKFSLMYAYFHVNVNEA